MNRRQKDILKIEEEGVCKCLSLLSYSPVPSAQKMQMLIAFKLW